MKEQEQIRRLKLVLFEALKWYEKAKKENDDDYIYDNSYVLFSDLSRSQATSILDILSE